MRTDFTNYPRDQEFWNKNEAAGSASDEYLKKKYQKIWYLTYFPDWVSWERVAALATELQQDSTAVACFAVGAATKPECWIMRRSVDAGSCGAAKYTANCVGSNETTTSATNQIN